MHRLGLILLTVVFVLTAGLVSRLALAQTEVNQPALPLNLRIEAVAADVTFPVSLRFTPDGRLFFTERFVGADAPVTGTIRVMVEGQLQEAPFAVVSLANSSPFAEKGLLGFAIDPDFVNNGYVYAYRTAPPSAELEREHGQVLRYTSVLSGTNWVGADLTVIVDDLPVAAGCCHNGGAIDFGPDGMLYVSVGDTGRRHLVQNLDSRVGKLMRFNADGRIPDDNPFVDQENADPAVYAFGLRNVFGFDWHPETGTLIASENGPRCNDELNRIIAGGNYGWPESLKDGLCVDPGSEFIAPELIVDPPVGLTDTAFYVADWPADFKNDFFVGSWAPGDLYRVRVSDDGGKPALITLLSNCGQLEGDHNMLAVEMGPDGSLYFSCQQDLFPAPPNTGTIYRLVYEHLVYVPFLSANSQ